jgi:hypothetical protein
MQSFFHKQLPFADKTFASGFSTRFVINFLSLSTAPDKAILPKILEKFKKYFFLLRGIFKNAKHTPKKCFIFLIALYQSVD